MPVPSRSKPKISSLELWTATGPFFACPGPIIALFGSVFFYFFAFSAMNIFMSVALFAGSSLYPGSTKVSSGSFFTVYDEVLMPIVLRVV